jgi:hypothetical protein
LSLLNLDGIVLTTGDCRLVMKVQKFPTLVCSIPSEVFLGRHLVLLAGGLLVYRSLALEASSVSYTIL